jgi:hypothetical protein
MLTLKEACAALQGHHLEANMNFKKEDPEEDHSYVGNISCRAMLQL